AMRRPALDYAAVSAAVVDAGGFRAAADRRGVAPSSLSDRIRRLERELGVRLLHRTTRSVTPTEAGIRLLDRLRPALAEIESAFDDLGEDTHHQVGIMRLNVPVLTTRFLLPTLITEFLARYPRFIFEVSMDNSHIDGLPA